MSTRYTTVLERLPHAQRQSTKTCLQSLAVQLHHLEDPAQVGVQINNMIEYGTCEPLLQATAGKGNAGVATEAHGLLFLDLSHLLQEAQTTPGHLLALYILDMLDEGELWDAAVAEQVRQSITDVGLEPIEE